MNQLEGNHGSRSRLDFRVNPCRQYLQKYLEGDFLRDLLASMAAGVVTLDLNPAGWISDAVSTSVGVSEHGWRDLKVLATGVRSSASLLSRLHHC